MKEKAYIIFLVDDDQVFLKALELHLKEHLKYKVEIHTFSNGEDCLKNMRISPLVIVLDYYLDSKNPDAANGIEILKKIKNIDPETEVIMLTREDNMQVALEIMNNGAFNYYTKNDIIFKRFQNIINKIIQQKRVSDIFKDSEYITE